MRLVGLSPNCESISPGFFLARECIFSFRYVLHIQGLEFQITFRALEVEHLLDHPVQWRVRKQMLLALSESITTSDVAVVTSEPDLFEIHRWSIFIHYEQSWFKLQPSLVNGHRMPDVSCWWICNDLIRRTPQRNFELTDTVDTVEQSKEVDSNIWSAESFVEILHEQIQLFVLFALIFIATGLLEAAEGIPSKLDHFLVTLGKKAKVIDHLSKEPCRVSATRETEDVNVISRFIVTHGKTVSCQDMLLERAANHLINRRDNG